MKTMIYSLIAMLLVCSSGCEKHHVTNSIIIEKDYKNAYTGVSWCNIIPLEGGTSYHFHVETDTTLLFTNLPYTTLLAYVDIWLWVSYGMEVLGWKVFDHKPGPCAIKLSQIMPRELVKLNITNIASEIEAIRVYRVVDEKVDPYFMMYFFPISNAVYQPVFTDTHYILAGMNDDKDIGYMQLYVTNKSHMSELECSWRNDVINAPHRYYVSKNYFSKISLLIKCTNVKCEERTHIEISPE
jgi:hypothetical protein